MIKPASIKSQDKASHKPKSRRQLNSTIYSLKKQLFANRTSLTKAESEIRNLNGIIHRLKTENENLRTIFSTAGDEFEKLRNRAEKAEHDLELEKEKNRELEKENKELHKLLDKTIGLMKKYRMMLFGSAGEKNIGNDADIINETIDITCSDSDTAGHTSETESETGKEGNSEKPKRRRGARHGHKGSGRNKIPDSLPAETTIEDINEKEKICPYCGLPREECFGLDKTVVRIGIKIIIYRQVVKRKTYKSTCSCKGFSKFATAPYPPSLSQKKDKYNEEVWAGFLISKYQFHMPIERQLFKFHQAGVNIKPGTVFKGLKRIYYDYLKVLHEVMKEEIRKVPRLHADETRWYVFLDNSKKLWYMWAFRSENMVVFVIDKTRAADVPMETIFGIKEDDIKQLCSGSMNPVEVSPETVKILSVDRYSAYKVLQKYGLVVLAYCWVHQRRDFVNLKVKYDDNPEICSWADEWISKIGELYHINNQRIKFDKESENFKSADSKLRSSLENIKQIIGSDTVHPHEEQNKIMNSMREHWNGLNIFVEHPEVPMDNNLIERTIRPEALGRKNYTGNRSIWGTELTACMYSIIQTCLINEVDPEKYLLHYFRAFMKKKIPGKELDKKDVKKLLPQNLANSVREKIKLKKF